jgi:hypothetical protein
VSSTEKKASIDRRFTEEPVVGFLRLRRACLLAILQDLTSGIELAVTDSTHTGNSICVELCSLSPLEIKVVLDKMREPCHELFWHHVSLKIVASLTAQNLVTNSVTTAQTGWNNMVNGTGLWRSTVKTISTVEPTQKHARILVTLLARQSSLLD